MSRPPLGLCLRSYRPQRRWQVDCLEDGYVHRLPPAEKRWMEGFLREAYAVDAKRVRTGLHADRLKPEHVERLPSAIRSWWGRQAEFWPSLALRAAMRRLGLKREDLDSERRRALYREQNAAGRDVYSLGRVVYLEETEGDK